jgi:hypothetical protein
VVIKGNEVKYGLRDVDTDCVDTRSSHYLPSHATFLGTHLSGHGTLKDAQGALRHPSIMTTGNVYVQVVEDNVMRAVNSHVSTVLEGWRPAVESMGLTGPNVKRLSEPFSGSGSNLVKFGEV